MPTLNRHTLKIIDGFDEILQSLEIILTTPRGSRVMRRHFGVKMMRIVDKPISPLTLIDFYATIAEVALEEPRFRLEQMSLATDSDIANGQALFDLEGIWYPRGHLGDYSEARDARGRIIVRDPGTTG